MIYTRDTPLTTGSILLSPTARIPYKTTYASKGEVHIQVGKREIVLTVDRLIKERWHVEEKNE